MNPLLSHRRDIFGIYFERIKCHAEFGCHRIQLAILDVRSGAWVDRFIYAMTSVSIPMPHQTPLV